MIPPDDNFSKKEMKECLDCEVDLCNYLRKYEDMYDLVYSYWEGLECNVDKNFADLAYEARQSFI